MQNCIFYEEDGVTGAFQSPSFVSRDASYSVQMVMGPGVTYNMELQGSLDNVNWVTIVNPVSSIITNETAESVLYDNRSGYHRYLRIVGEVTAGTANIKGYVSR